MVPFGGSVLLWHNAAGRRHAELRHRPFKLKGKGRCRPNITSQPSILSDVAALETTAAKPKEAAAVEPAVDTIVDAAQMQSPALGAAAADTAQMQSPAPGAAAVDTAQMHQFIKSNLLV